jgi:hypothetical protein
MEQTPMQRELTPRLGSGGAEGCCAASKEGRWLVDEDGRLADEE